MGEYLVENGQSVRAARDGEWDPFEGAVERGHSRLVDYLAKKGAVGNLSSFLHTAALKGHSRVVEQLVILRANLELRDKNGMTPIEVARKSGNQEAVKALRRMEL